MTTRYQSGQAWRYKDAAHPDSRAIVGAVEDIPSIGPVVSMSITFIWLPNWETGAPALKAISHAPVTAAAMDGSVIRGSAWRG